MCAITRSPGMKPCTPSPTCLTTPAISLPGEKGSSGLNWYLFWMRRTSGKFTPLAFTETRSCPLPGAGDGTSSTTSESGGPQSLHSTALMRAFLRSCRHHSRPVASATIVGLPCIAPEGGFHGRRHHRQARAAMRGFLEAGFRLDHRYPDPYRRYRTDRGCGLRHAIRAALLRGENPNVRFARARAAPCAGGDRLLALPRRDPREDADLGQDSGCRDIRDAFHGKADRPLLRLYRLLHLHARIHLGRLRQAQAGLARQACRNRRDLRRRLTRAGRAMGSLSGKIAWVTGGGSGIGQGAAVELAKAGASVVVSGRRAAALAETEALIKQAGGKGEAEAVDTSDKQAVVRASAAILARHGRIDILVNCAGTNVPKRFFKDLAAADWDRVVAVNLNGALYCTLAVLPSMRERRDGLVIHVASYFARYQSYLGGAAYNASKQALCALVHQINIEEGMHGIRGCAIHPGETVTPLQKARPKPPSPEDQAKMLKMEDLGRVVRFVAESPTHVCVNEIVVTPTWNRLILGGGEMLLAPKIE